MISYTDTTIPLPSDYPLPSTRYQASSYFFGARLYIDDSWGEVGDRPIALYFHGSGSTVPTTGPLLDGLIAEGFAVLATMDLGVWNSSPEPYLYGYGNVNAPHFLASFIKNAWWVQSAVDWVAASYPTNKKIVVGHSMGASAAIAWGAGYTRGDPQGVDGMVCSGATVGGLGTLSWNDVNRNMNTLSGMIPLIKVKSVLAWGGDDSYAPPDYVRRVQQVLSPEDPVYIACPGDAMTHSWINTAAGAPIAIDWIYKLAAGEDLGLVPGPAAGE